MKNYTRRFSKSLISNPLSDFQNSMVDPIWRIKYGRKKLEKTSDFRKNEHTRVFGSADHKWQMIFEKHIYRRFAVIKTLLTLTAWRLTMLRTFFLFLFYNFLFLFFLNIFMFFCFLFFCFFIYFIILKNFFVISSFSYYFWN